MTKINQRITCEICGSTTLDNKMNTYHKFNKILKKFQSDILNDIIRDWRKSAFGVKGAPTEKEWDFF